MPTLDHPPATSRPDLLGALQAAEARLVQLDQQDTGPFSTLARVRLAVLQAGGVLVINIKSRIGGRLVMEYDAKRVCAGVTWFHVKGGIGGVAGRGDWIGDSPRCTRR